MASKTIQELEIGNSPPARYKRQDYRKNAYKPEIYLGLSIPCGYPKPKPSDNVALLIVDMEDKLLEKHYEEDKNRLIENQKELLGYCCHHDVPVVFVCGRGKKTTDEFLSSIEDVPRHISLEKVGNSCFANPNLDSLLKGWSIDIPIVSGINTPYCILATVESGTNLGYKMATSTELVSKSRRLSDKGSLDKLRKKCYFSESYKDLLPLFSLNK
jgi:hypothetical protein